MKSNDNPWNPRNKQQMQWINKWKNEIDLCYSCTKKASCTLSERLNPDICLCLRDRLGLR